MIVCIFDEGDYSMFAFHYKGQATDELTGWLETWTDPLELDSIFSDPSCTIDFQGHSIDDAIAMTYRLGSDVKRLLHSGKKTLIESFEPLRIGGLSERPMRQKWKRRWLRIYGLRIDNGCIVVTGCAFKDSTMMNDGSYTREELLKLDKARMLLRELGILDKDSIADNCNLDL